MKKNKILVVEDEPSYLHLMTDRLNALGYVVIQAKNGQKGLEIAKKEKPDLILLDIRMPVMDGIAMLEELRKDEFGKGVKVIVLTNIEPDPAITQKIISSKPICYLIKSDTKLEDLIKKIKELLVSNRISSW